jgi:SAM-dependent methyltransferase
MYQENRLSHNWLIKKLLNEKVLQHLPMLQGLVIDLGCGTRPYERDILAHAENYIGVDWNNTLHGRNADIVADLNKPLPFSENSTDCVVSFEVIEHLAEPDIMLLESYRILRHGGILLLSMPFQWWLHEEPWDYQRFTRFGLEYHLRKAGFENVTIQETTGFWSMWVLKLNYQLARLVRGPYLVRNAIRVLLIPLWWLNQISAPLIDRMWHEGRETAGYFAVAHKPCL